ncbi:MAG: tannase/feruloyl esterase family alpha/beta hydrolase [Rhodospirillaceae bacterium]|nr:tannase/feruloyl esterase family alpha/beta hydrolase [Rhodospirillaceae bacterium]
MLLRFAAIFLFGSLNAALAANAAVSIDERNCTAVMAQDFSKAVGAAVTIQSAKLMAATPDLPGYCHILANIAPSIGVEVRMPAKDWTGRFLFTGCGGLCGIINSAAGDDALLRNYAVATTDMGHKVPPSGDEREWSKDKGLVQDWLHRSTHLATVLAKAVVAETYGRAQDHAFYRGCSTGGRQGLTEALLYPEDFDGIIAGAPAAQMVTPHNVFAYASNTRPDGGPILTAKAISLLGEKAVAACDMDDGLKDGIIGNPKMCAFDPASLQCEGSASDQCLTAEQVSTADKIYNGARRGDGSPFYAMGYAKGSEASWTAGFIGRDGKPPGRAGSAAFLVEAVIGPTAKLSDFDYAKHGTTGGPLGGLLDYGPDGKKLAQYKTKGGKILLYHGWSDTDATPASSLDFYAAQAKAFGADNLPPFLRLFMLPGMAHCRGGNGVNLADFLSAMETWVEQGTAPDKLVAYKTNLPAQSYRPFPLKPETVLSSRPLFPYPATAVYSGAGSAADAVNWHKR